MEFHNRYDPYMVESHQDSTIIDEPEIENDPFYAELAKQVLLLTEEDDCLRSKDEYIGCQERSVRGLSAIGLPGNYLSCSEKEENLKVPLWLINLWTSNGRGTGVFIPHVVVKCSRKNKPKKKKNRKGRNENSTSSTGGETQNGRSFNKGPRGFFGPANKQGV